MWLLESAPCSRVPTAMDVDPTHPPNLFKVVDHSPTSMSFASKSQANLCL